MTLADTVPYAQALVDAGADYLSVSAGVYASFVNIIPPMDVAAGWLLPTAATIKRAVGVPVIGASRIVDPELAAQAIAGGEVDLVAMGRALLTDRICRGRHATVDWRRSSPASAATRVVRTAFRASAMSPVSSTPRSGAS